MAAAEVELEVPTDVAYVGLARLVVTTAARKAGMDDARVEDLKIAVSEATTNAILARQELGKEDPVVLSFGPRDTRFEVTIRDTGPAFEPDASHDDIAGGNSDAPDSSGLGVTVIRGLTDHVDFLRDGHQRVHMRFSVELGGEGEPPVSG